MINHPSPLAWSYLVLFSGVAIILLAFGMAIRGKRDDRKANPKLSALEDRFSRGEITQEEYQRRRAEILIEEYEKHRVA
jgi:uncharacterized membrane protein